MDERGWWSRLLAVLGAFVSFRVAVAMSTSVTVTVAVAGPMALEAYRVRHPDQEVAAEAPERPGDPARPAPRPTTTTSTTTTTTTTAPEAAPVTAPGRVATTTSAAPTTTVAGIGPDGLAAGVRDDRADAVALQGAVVTGEVYVFVEIDGATTVRFWLDDPNGAGTAVRTDDAAPFDLGDPLLDTATLGVGPHTLLAEAATPSGPVRRRATFEVR